MFSSNYQSAIETIENNGGSIAFEDEECVVNGTQVDIVKVETCWDGTPRIFVFAGFPDDLENDSDWEELELADDEMEKLCEYIIDYY